MLQLLLLLRMCMLCQPIADAVNRHATRVAHVVYTIHVSLQPCVVVKLVQRACARCGVRLVACPLVHMLYVQVKSALTSIEQSGKPSSLIMVVGAGYAGVELATVLAERMRGKAEVRLVTPGADILDGCPEGQREAARKVLVSMGVSIMTGV